jgi:hypothetical protein
MSDIVSLLREKPYRLAVETEDQAKLRRQEERERGAVEIERLQAAKRSALAIADERSKENVALRKALKSLTNEIHGLWDAFEYGLRAEISNTNYAVVRDKLAEAEQVLGAVGDAVRGDQR